MNYFPNVWARDSSPQRFKTCCWCLTVSQAESMQQLLWRDSVCFHFTTKGTLSCFSCSCCCVMLTILRAVCFGRIVCFNWFDRLLNGSNHSNIQKLAFSGWFWLTRGFFYRAWIIFSSFGFVTVVRWCVLKHHK